MDILKSTVGFVDAVLGAVDWILVVWVGFKIFAVHDLIRKCRTYDKGIANDLNMTA